MKVRLHEEAVIEAAEAAKWYSGDGSRPYPTRVEKLRCSMKWQERIEINPQVLVGKPVIKGTRIAVEFVIDLMGRGWSVERILHEYDPFDRGRTSKRV